MSIFSFLSSFKKRQSSKNGKENIRKKKIVAEVETIVKEKVVKSSDSLFRIRLTAIFFCLLWLGLWGRAWYLQMVAGPYLAAKAQKQHTTAELVSGRRGIIFDRNGQVLARSVEAWSIYARPEEIRDPENTANLLAPILGTTAQKIYKDLSTRRHFIWLKRKIDDYTAKRIQQAGLVGIGLSKEYDRIYPFKHLAGQVLGFVGLDGKGLEGIEHSLEDKLGGMPTRQVVQRDAMGRKFYRMEKGLPEPHGEDVTLTLDTQLQFIAEEALSKRVREFDARWGGVIVVDVKSGDILAWAQYPFFNPNTYRDYSSLVYRNRLALDALEPGSTFKPLVMAAALQEHKVTPNTLIDCESGRWANKNFVIRDTSIQKILPASKVLRYSSNIGMAKIGQNLGSATFYAYLKKLGFGSTTSVPVPESRGILRSPREWGSLDVMFTAFGQSIAVTGLQMAQAYLTLLNNGVYKPLRLVFDNATVEEPRQRIFSAKTVHQVMDMMRDVVEEADGTGRRAHIDGLEVGGKTGTAQKADTRSGSYGGKRLASFVGFFPVQDPAYFILVMVDEPERSPFGGVVAAPIFSEIGRRIVTYTGLLADAGKNNKTTDSEKNTRQRQGLKVVQLTENFLDLISDMPTSVATPKKSRLSNIKTTQAEATKYVPNVLGKSARSAVEIFAGMGVIPQLKGTGNRVTKQMPPAGSAWPQEGQDVQYILWL